MAKKKKKKVIVADRQSTVDVWNRPVPHAPRRALQMVLRNTGRMKRSDSKEQIYIKVLKKKLQEAEELLKVKKLQEKILKKAKVKKTTWTEFWIIW